jgi:dihydroxy-acid dehydratase
MFTSGIEFSLADFSVQGHIVPEARLGGPIALVKDGDRIVIDSEKRTIEWLVDGSEQALRKKEWEASDKGTLTVSRGILLRYARDVAVSAICACLCSSIYT